MKKKLYSEQLCTGDSCAKFVEMNESEVNANDRV